MSQPQPPLSPQTNDALAVIVRELDSLPALVDRAAAALRNARSSAEVLETRDTAGSLYDLAKRTGRLLKAKQAHDELIAAAYRAQGDALLIESQAKMRLADEYDAAQERGEIEGHGGERGNQYVAKVPDENVATTSDIGLTRKEVHEARQLRDAEAAEPGIVRRAVEHRVDAGQEPTKAAIREAVRERVASDQPVWSPDDIATVPRRGPYITGDAAIHHAIRSVKDQIIPLGGPRAAMRRYPPQLSHCLTVGELHDLSRWFASAAEEWSLIQGASRVAAE